MTVVVAGNVVADNGGSGLKVNDTSRVSIWNNTFTGNDREVDIVQDDRDLDSQGSYLDPSAASRSATDRSSCATTSSRGPRAPRTACSASRTTPVVCRPRT